MEENLTIRTNCNNNKTYITVIGELENNNEIDELEDLISTLENKKFEIIFLGANVLPKNIIERITILQEDNKCSIFVLKRYLFSYLQCLGIKCNYITETLAFKKTDYNLSCEKEKPRKEEIYNFLKNINKVYGYDYTEYQIDSIMRRINISMIRGRIDDFNIFTEQVLNNQKIFHDLFLDLSINTTEFFRDNEVFSMIKNKILPYLNSYSHVKIWCAGCSIGKEVYSLAIILKEANMLSKTQIYATDINPYVIEEARNGLYSISNLEKDISNYRNAEGEKNFIEYFDINKSYIKIKENLKKNILFFQHSLLSEGRLNEFNLILCRNVFIYFNDSLQGKVLKNFYNSLDDNGFLVLGKSEGIQKNNGYRYFYKYSEKNKIYRKINTII